MKRLILMLLIAFLIVAAAKGQSVDIPIQNPSFEASVNFESGQQPCGPLMNSNDGPIPGWTFPPTSGNALSGVVQWTCGPLPDGKQAAYVVNGIVSQDLEVPLQQGTYVLSFWIANWFYGYSNKYKVWLSDDIGELCSIGGYSMGDFVQIPLTCTIGYNVWANSKGTLKLSFSAGTTDGSAPNPIWYELFDEFSLIFTPES